MSNIIPLDFNNHPIRIINDDTGQPWFVLSDVCKALSLTNPSAVADRLDDDEKSNPKPDLGLRVDQLLINESGLFSVILRSDKPSAKVFKKWLTSEVLPNIRNNGFYSSHSPTTNAANILLFKVAIEVLNPGPASIISMLKKLGESSGLNVDFLPEYLEAPHSHHSLTELLKKYNSSISTLKANTILIKLGLIRVETRQSSRGRQKEYKVITADGLHYGINLVTPKNQSESQPHWYDDTFPELLALITNKHEETIQLAS